MTPDDDICYCYHVPLRKLHNFAKRSDLQRPSQMSECLGAGTGCGWCIPILKKIYEASCMQNEDIQQIVDMTAEQYAQARDRYRKSGQPKNQF